MSMQGKHFRLIKLLVLAALAVLPAQIVDASEAGPGVVSDVQIDGAKVIFAVSGSRSARPSCAAWDRFVFSAGAENSAALLAYLLSAQASGKRIRVYGNGACNVVSDHETVWSLRDG